uniref:Mitochondrial processing peptidase n=1 Tax=Acrobeloides nanus TaxID=290746 RepID=A0A914ECH4_9BILA
MPTATVGVWIDAGSRYENEKNNGTAHFLEHMAFKGTRKRSQHDLELEVETIGAHLNAYTSREQTVYYAKCFEQDLERAVEILADILLNSVYGKQEIERERGVILREMEEVEQNMQEVVFDHLHEGVFRGTPLARTILGPVKNIKSITREDLVAYITKYYKGPRMVLAAAGGVEHEYLVSLAQKYFGHIERGTDEVLQYEPGNFSPSYHLIPNANMDMAYGTLVVEGTSWTHPDNIPMQLANTLIGNFDRTQSAGLITPSRLARRMELSDGVHSFMSFTTSYKDTGLSGIYFTAEEQGLRTISEAVCTEWKRLAEEVDENELERAKKSLYTNMLLMLDGSTPICEDIGRQLLCYGRRISIPELELRIMGVNTNTIKDIARRYFLNRPVGFTVIGPTKNWPRAEEIAKWLRT